MQRRTFDPADQRKLLEDTIRDWQAKGPQAIWDASFELLNYWFAIRGLDPDEQRIDRKNVRINPVPWQDVSSEGEG